MWPEQRDDPTHAGALALLTTQFELARFVQLSRSSDPVAEWCGSVPDAMQCKPNVEGLAPTSIYLLLSHAI